MPATGWAVGDGGAILKSTDGGATWSRANPTPILNRNLQPTPAHLNTIFMLDDDNGWVGGDDGAFYKTTTGWDTWSFPSGCTLPPEFNTSADPQDIYKIKFHDAQNGFLAADYGDAYTTSDGGCTWVPASIFGACVSGPPEELHNLELWDFEFSSSDPSEGWMAGGFGIQEGFIFRTDDGGATWDVSSCFDLSSIPTQGDCTPPSFYGVAMPGSDAVVVGYGSQTMVYESGAANFGSPARLVEALGS